ncbi:PQQ-dependent sugar dehydrogenase [Alloalcanivorax xenomutans]|uniref:PQQ-dependent sugar dehydrogenase n=1 Tax=Alloalcanivorax xenomutans TaxID=1094342 RepID=UPI0020A31A2C|nr:PQQ-dependent sugar dehydrogenase [Alloalcanivorax xenomutans]
MPWKKQDTPARGRTPRAHSDLPAIHGRRWLAGLLLGFAAPVMAGSLPVDSLTLPEGFTLTVFADDVPNARQLAQAEDGTVFAGSRDEGKVYAIRDADGDGRAERTWVLAEGLNMPSGIAYRDGTLYVAAVNRILALPDILDHLDDPPALELVTDQFPSDSHHGWKYLAFDREGKLIVPVGAPCNICNREEPYATIQRYDPDSGEMTTVARGVRNSVGFDFHPRSGQLWFTDNGRDMLGDEIPPEELNRVREDGEHFGYPFIHGGTVPDPEFGKDHDPGEFAMPMQTMPAHHAPLGMTFYTGEQFPEDYRGDIFIAEHGSWNRSTPAGYRVTRVGVEGIDKVAGYQPFISGWLREDGTRWGRPADVMQAADGSLLIADDHAGAIYRVVYQGN